MKREFTVDETARLDRVRGLVDEAYGHFDAAVTAHNDTDDKALAAAHIRLGRCLRSAQKAIKEFGKSGEAADIAANQKAQTSAGVTEGTSGRGSPLYTQGNAGIPGWLQRAREGGRRS